jgi:hypothetical protein
MADVRFLIQYDQQKNRERQWKIISETVTCQSHLREFYLKDDFHRPLLKCSLSDPRRALMYGRFWGYYPS